MGTKGPTGLRCSRPMSSASATQFGEQVIGDRQANHAAGVDVEDDRGVDPAFDGAVLDDGDHSQPIRARCDEAVVYQIRPRGGRGSPVAPAAAVPPFRPPSLCTATPACD